MTQGLALNLLMRPLLFEGVRNILCRSTPLPLLVCIVVSVCSYCSFLFILQFFNILQENAVEAEMVATKDISMEPTVQTLNEDLV